MVLQTHDFRGLTTCQQGAHALYVAQDRAWKLTNVADLTTEERHPKGDEMFMFASAACALRFAAPRGHATMVPRPAVRVLMTEPDVDVPTPGGFKDTANRLKADFQSGKDAADAYMSGSTPQSEAAEPTASGAVAAALLAALQVEAAQFVLVFSGAWLFGVGIPAAAAPATGVRLHTAVLAAVASRHPTRLLRLPLEALRWRAVRRGLRRGGFEYLKDQVAQPLAVLLTVVFTARALERTALVNVATAPILFALGTLGLAEQTERAGARLAGEARMLWTGFARAEDLVNTNLASSFVLGLSELDAKLLALLKASWRTAVELDARMVALFNAARDAAERMVLATPLGDFLKQ